MPTLLNKDGFKFFFYANEHEPRHIHVINADGFAKIELGSLQIIRSTMKQGDLTQSLQILCDHNDAFERRWDEFFKR